jgi:hypothetical protein
LTSAAENEVDGEVLVVLTGDDLRQIGVISTGHRLKILKNIYDTKRHQQITIKADHYIPESKSTSRGFDLRD